MSDNGKIALGAVVALLAAGGIAYVISTEEDEQTNQDGAYPGALVERYDEDVACRVEAFGLRLIAQGLARGHHAGAINQSASAFARGCKTAIETWASSRRAAVELEIEAPDGTTLSTTASRLDLTAAPQPPPQETPRAIQCLEWRAPVLIQYCLDAQIEPPAG